MNSGHFLVSLREVNNSEKMLSLNSIIKAHLNFWEDNIYAEKKTDGVTLKLHTQFDEMTNKISECQLNEESKEVAVSIVSYVTKTLSSQLDCNQCKEKLIFNNKDNGYDHGKYLSLLSQEVLTVPS